MRAEPHRKPTAAFAGFAGITLVMTLLIALVSFASVASAGEVVSLGDSYSSGEGNAPYDHGTDVLGGGCHRSPNAWPRMVGVTADHHLACSGAVIDNLDRTPQHLIGPGSQTQIKRLATIAADTPISRVVMTIGGNDSPIRFGDHLKDCVLRNCLHDDKSIIARLPRLKSRLAAIYRRVSSTAHAPLLVVGYPDLFPAPKTPEASAASSHCPWMTDGAITRFDAVADAFDTTLRDAAAAAGVDYLSIRDALKEHEFCTQTPYLKRLAPFDQEAGHPLFTGQVAIADRVSRWLFDHRENCTPQRNVAAIVDDSGSMANTDPDKIRAQALRLILTKPTNQSMTLGAVEFGGDAGPLFTPGLVGTNQQSMLNALSALNNDGVTDGDNTDYNEAFAASAQSQPNPGARIFLTDGGHNVGSYSNPHAGGPATYVIGLGIGPSGRGGDSADLLGRIASETGGRYYPLKLRAGDSSQLQLSRLQPALNDIDTRIACHAVQAEGTVALRRKGQRSRALTSVFGGMPGVEVVISWADPDADVGIRTMTVRDRLGRVVGDLNGTRRISPRRSRLRTKLRLDTVAGDTFETVTLRRPPDGRTIALTVGASKLPAQIPVTVQIRPLDSLPTGSAPNGGGPNGSGGTSPEPAAASLVATSPSANTVALSAEITAPAALGAMTCRTYQDGTLLATDPCAGGHFSKTIGGVTAGHHSYFLTVVDASGQAGPASNTAQVDVSDPAPTPVTHYSCDNTPSAFGHYVPADWHWGNDFTAQGSTITGGYLLLGANVDGGNHAARIGIYTGGPKVLSGALGEVDVSVSGYGGVNFTFPHPVQVTPGQALWVAATGLGDFTAYDQNNGGTNGCLIGRLDGFR